MKIIKNPPHASTLMNSIRSIGYSFESAISDILDNSISAQAQNIHVIFPASPECIVLGIYDDGIGMDEVELCEAMRYGSHIPNRCAHDLGRFGLGLKTASLSQCRHLAVVSKRNNKLHAFAWDLDKVQEENDWTLLELSHNEIFKLPYLEYLDKGSSGTLVLLKSFDGFNYKKGSEYRTLHGFQSKLYNYIALIFHTFISNGLKIHINDKAILGLDPFLTSHKKTDPRKPISMPINIDGESHQIEIKPYVLPYQKDISDEDFKLLGGFDSYKHKQGFYIYRKSRLIVHGTWFGLPKHDLTRSARIRVDIPNTLDAQFGIDVKKQHAVIPPEIQVHLKKSMEEVMGKSKDAHQYRGRKENVNENPIWSRIKLRENAYVFEINRSSKIFELISDLDSKAQRRIEMILKEIERSLPYVQIHHDWSNNVLDHEDQTQLGEDLLEWIYCRLEEITNQQDKKKFLTELFLDEPFKKYPDLLKKIINEAT